MTEPVNVKNYFYGKTFSIQGRIFYPKILAPEAKKNATGGDGRLQYSCLFAWAFGSNAGPTSEIGQFLQAAKQQFWPTVPPQFFINPIKKFGEYQRQDGKPPAAFLTNTYWLNAQSGADYPPVIVDSQRQPLVDPALVYSGMNAVINISFYPIDNEKKGVGVNLNAVMVMPGGEKEGGVPQVNVGQVFGDFAADMGMPADTAVQAAPVQQAPVQQAPVQEAAPQQWPPQNNTNEFM